MKSKQFEVTGTCLKIIALISMIIDHVGYGIYEKWMEYSDFLNPSFDYKSHYIAYEIMRGVGRMAFPIFCYMLVVGYYNTRNIYKYAGRLLAVAIISEIPFDMFLYNRPVYFELNNVIWELLLGLIVVYVIDHIKDYGKPLQDSDIAIIIVKLLFMAAAIALGMFAAHITCLDYGEGGIALISVLYLLQGTYSKYSRMLALCGGIFILTYFLDIIELAALFVLIPFYFYTGKRGRDSKALRVFFYLSYPLHFVLLFFVRMLLFSA